MIMLIRIGCGSITWLNMKFLVPLHTLFKIVQGSVKLWLLSPKLPQELDGIVDDLNATQDGESSKKPHGASDKTQGGLQSHLHVLLNLVVGCSAKVNLNHFHRWILNGAS